MTSAPRRSQHGFTLIEVLVAVIVVALGIGALLVTLVSSADNVSRLREKSFAEWIALNRIAETRLSRTRPEVGTSDGEVEYAGSRWQWRQEVTDPGQAGILRVDVSVARLAERAPATTSNTSPDKGADFPAIATAYGFVGTAIARGNGIDPDWSLSAAAAPGIDGQNPDRGNTAPRIIDAPLPAGQVSGP